MSAHARRRVIGGLLVSGGLVCFGGLLPAPSIAQPAPAIPSGPMRLSRMLERSLRGGAFIRVTRDWRVDFKVQGRGIAITGEQLSATVEAPESLASLARIEETRSTDGMWPILLSAYGHILAAGNGLDEAELDSALAEAQKILSDRGGSDVEVQLRYLRTVSQIGASLLDQLPHDLFFPDGELHNSVRELEIEEGLSGIFAVRYQARPSANGWLDRTSREVITRIGDSERRAIEEWSLSPI